MYSGEKESETSTRLFVRHELFVVMKEKGIRPTCFFVYVRVRVYARGQHLSTMTSEPSQWPFSPSLSPKPQVGL